jgi:hypothetical protein
MMRSTGRGVRRRRKEIMDRYRKRQEDAFNDSSEGGEEAVNYSVEILEIKK